MKGLLKTKFFMALLAFMLASSIASYFAFGKSKATDFPFLSWTAWTIQDFLSSKERANIVFLGSSLVLVPLDGVDADYLQRKIDGSQHHHSSYFENNLKTKTNIDSKTYTFALPGEMPSDAYLIVKNLLLGQHKPDLIVYGVGPRDFLDNMLPSPASTDPFRFLSKFGDITPIASRVLPEWNERFDFELGKLCYFYSQRNSFSTNSERALASTINKVLPLQRNSNIISFDEQRLLLPNYKPCQILAGQAWFRPSTKADHDLFVDNLPEYKKRYAKMCWDTYISQMRFFADTIETAKSRGINVVVVAMPITDLNRSVLSNLSWNAYQKGVLAIAKRKGASVLDLSESNQFSRSDFSDTVHLHSGGGKLFLDLLSDFISKDKDLIASLKNSNYIASKIANKKVGGQL